MVVDTKSMVANRNGKEDNRVTRKKNMSVVQNLSHATQNISKSIHD